MKRKKSYYECRILYRDKFKDSEKILAEIEQAKKEGWHISKHYHDLTSNRNKLKFKQEVYWWANVSPYADMDFRHKIFEIKDFSDKDLSVIADAIARLMNEKEGHLGTGYLHSLGRIRTCDKSYFCHLYILIKKTKK